MPAKRTNKKTTARKSVKTEAAMATAEALEPVNPNGDTFADNYLYSWETPEFPYHEKSAIWHLAVYGSLAFLILLVVILKEWFAVPVFVLIGVVVYQFAEVKPRDISVVITNLGIIVGEKFYPFNEIKAFWIVFKPPVETLNIELTKRFSPIITLNLEGNDPTLVKELLREHILEEPERKEDLIEKLTKFIRF